MQRAAPLAGAVVLALACRADAAPPESGAGDMVAYRIQAGDTLESIVRRYLVSRSDIAALEQVNHISNPRRLRIGADLLAPRARLRTEVASLRVDSFSGSVTAGSATAPHQVKVGSLVREGDVVITGPNSFVTLAFADGTLMTLPSLTRARLEAAHRILLNDSIERLISIERGRGTYEVTPLHAPRDRFEVRTPMAVAAVRGTEFRVDYDPQAARSILEVLEGDVAERGDHDADYAEVETGVAAERRAGQSGRALVSLPPAPDLQRPGRVQDGVNVEFAIDSPKPGNQYRVQLADDAGFTELFAETVVTEGAAAFPNVPNGTFFVRATTLDGDGVEGLPRTYGFERRYTSLSAGVAASPARAGPRSYAFRWRAEGEGRLTYQFILAKDPALQQRVVDEAGLTRTDLSIVDLPPGTYYWRVTMTQSLGERVNRRELRVNELRIASEH
jgi:hypothetical protein